MSDNVTTQDTDIASLPPGETFAFDDIGGVKWQRVKVAYGDDGTATDASATNPLPVNDATGNTTLATLLTTSDFDTKAGSLTETAPATDTASSGLNGRLQRIAQRLTSLLGVFPATIDTNSGVKSASTLRVVLATDQPALTNKLLVTPDANSAVNLGQVGGSSTATGHGTAAGSLRVELPTDGTGVVGLNAGTNTVGKTFSAYQTTKALTHASVSISSSGDNTVIAGTALQTIRVYRLVLIAASAVNVTIKDGASTSLTGSMPLSANGGIAIDDSSCEPEFVTSAGNGFIVNLGGAVGVTGWVQYTKS